MYNDMRARSKANLPIRTWGGREYYCEPPMIINGRVTTFDYKMVNVLVQGSSADCTKEAVIRFHATRRSPKWRILLQVHDEIVLSAPKAEFPEAMETLRLAMESVKLDVPMLSEGSYSAFNWSQMKDYDKKGKLVPLMDGK